MLLDWIYCQIQRGAIYQATKYRENTAIVNIRSKNLSHVHHIKLKAPQPPYTSGASEKINAEIKPTKKLFVIMGAVHKYKDR